MGSIQDVLNGFLQGISSELSLITSNDQVEAARLESERNVIIDGLWREHAGFKTWAEEFFTAKVNQVNEMYDRQINLLRNKADNVTALNAIVSSGDINPRPIERPSREDKELIGYHEAVDELTGEKPAPKKRSAA